MAGSARMGAVWGTYLHGLFDNDQFRRALRDELRENHSAPETIREELCYQNFQEAQLNRLADLLRRHLDMAYIKNLIPTSKMTDTSHKTPPHGGDVYHLARSLGIELADLLDFSASINPLGFPSGLYGATQEALKEIVHYPDRRCLALRQDLADYHHLSPEEILVGNGSTELI